MTQHQDESPSTNPVPFRQRLSGQAKALISDPDTPKGRRRLSKYESAMRFFLDAAGVVDAKDLQDLDSLMRDRRAQRTEGWVDYDHDLRAVLAAYSQEHPGELPELTVQQLNMRYSVVRGESFPGRPASSERSAGSEGRELGDIGLVPSSE